MNKTLVITLLLGLIVTGIVLSFQYRQTNIVFGEGTSAAAEISRTINAANYTYCRTVTSNNNGYTNGIGTTTSLLFPLYASSTISTLAATSSSGRIQRIATSTAGFTDVPIDVVFTDESTCSFNTSISAIPHYFEKYASTTGAFSVHLGTSNISSTTAKVLAMYYGNTAASNLNSPGQTFATSSPTGIVSHWDLSVPGYATTTYPDFTDSTYNNNHGSSKTMNNADLVSGQVDGALDFDGTNDFVSVPHNSTLQPSSAITIALWVKTSVADRWLVEKLDLNTGSNNGYRLHGNSDGTASFDVQNAGVLINSVTTSTIAGNVWIHLAATFNAGNTVIYVNGVQQDSDGAGPTTIGSNTNSLFIGKRVNDTDYHNGLIDDVRVYNRALTYADIQTIYNTTRDSTTFWTFGAEQTQGAAPSIENVFDPIIWFFSD